MSLESRRVQVYPPPEKKGLHVTRTEIYFGRRDSASGMQAASGFNNDKDAGRL